jgi:Ni/Co efflux regulator RcnB
MIRAVVRSVLVVCLLAGVGYAGTPAAPAATSVQAHKAKRHHHKKKVRKARRRKHRHHHHKAKHR